MKHRVFSLLLAACAGALTLPAQARGDVGVAITIHEPGVRGHVSVGPSWRGAPGPVLVVPGPVIVERGGWEPVPVYGWRPAYREVHHPHGRHWRDRYDHHHGHDAHRGWRHARWHHGHERCQEDGPRARVYVRADD